MSSANLAKQPPKKSKTKKIVIIAVIAAVVAVVVGTIVAITMKNWDEYQQLAADRQTVATCNGYEIPYEELRFVTLFYKDSLETKYGAGIWDDPATAEQYREELETLVFENLNENYIILSACKNLSIPTEGKDIDEYVNNQIKQLVNSFPSETEYENWLAEHWMTEHYMRFSIGVSYLESAIYYALLDNDLYKYRQDNIREFMDYVEFSGNYVRTTHIYIENVDGEDPAENLAKAQDIYHALDNCASFQERLDLMNEYIGSTVNDDLQSVSGHGYYFTRGEMAEEYEAAAFDLEIGEVSEPVVCSGGNFVIMRLTPESEYITQNAQTLLNNYHSVALGIYEEQFREVCDVQFNEYGQSIDLVNMK